MDRSWRFCHGKKPQRKFKEKYHQLGALNGNFEIIKQVTRVRYGKEDTKLKFTKIEHDRTDEDINKKLQRIKLRE